MCVLGTPASLLASANPIYGASFDSRAPMGTRFTPRRRILRLRNMTYELQENKWQGNEHDHTRDGGTWGRLPIAE